MKKIFYSLVVGAFALTSSTVMAQDKKIKTAQKGYYSMPKKAATLPSNQQPASETAISSKAPKVTKGYYSIGRNNEKLPAPTTTILIGDISPVRKGYYSIQ